MNNGFKFCFIVFLNMNIQLFQHHLLKRLCFLLYIAFVKKKKKPLLYMGLFLNCILFHLSVYLLMPHYTLDYCRFVLSLEIKESWVFHLYSSLSELFGYFRSFAFPCEFLNQLVNLYQNSLLGLHWISRSIWGRTDILTVFNLLTHEQGVSLPLFQSSLIPHSIF